MGQSTSKEGDRLAELAWMIAHAHSSMLKMQPLAAAEEAANEPPTPDSSQAAYHASRQRYLILTHERHLINRRVDELDWGTPNPRPMPRPVPPLPPKVFPTSAGAAEAAAAAWDSRPAASRQRTGFSSPSSTKDHAGGDVSVPLLSGGVEPASRGFRRRQRQEGVG